MTLTKGKIMYLIPRKTLIFSIGRRKASEVVNIGSRTSIAIQRVKQRTTVDDIILFVSGTNN